VTNSTVAATDTISLSVQSSNAANTYIANVTAVAAGSFRISFNITPSTHYKKKTNKKTNKKKKKQS